MVIEPAHPFSEAGLQNVAHKTSQVRSGSVDSAGSAGLTMTDAPEGLGGGPATGTLARLEAFAVGRSDALADML
jgi:hypothetical protein